MTAVDVHPEIEQASHRIAEELVAWSEAAVHPVLISLCEDHASGYEGVIYRVGAGRSTCHRRPIDGSRESTITYGAIMVADHLVGDYSGWLHVREINRFGFVDGNTSPPYALAHVVVHEIGHALQTHREGRFRGSVHNTHFYRAVRDLYAELGREALMRGIKRIEATFVDAKQAVAPAIEAERRKPRRSRMSKPKAVVDSRSAAFLPGQTVRFSGPRRAVITARVDRVNPKTCTVTCLDSGQEYRVPYSLLEKKAG